MRGAFGLLVVASLIGGCSTPAPKSIGDCLSNLDSPNPQVVNCDSPHGAQIVGTYPVPGNTYPGVEELQNAARIPCEEAFESFVGIPAMKSVFDLVPLLPTYESWAEKEDRTVLCVARPTGEEELTASIEGVTK